MFQRMRKLAQKDPKLIPVLLIEIGKNNPQLLHLISSNAERFSEMLKESADGDEGARGSGPDDIVGGDAGGGITPKEQQDIDILMQMFPEAASEDCIQAYFACNKNVDSAVGFLCGMGECH